MGLKGAFTRLLAVGATLLLVACSGSEDYRGEWKGMDNKNAQVQVIFAEKSLTLTDVQSGQSKTHQDTQNRVAYSSGRKTYGLEIKGGAPMQVVFPFEGDNSRAALTAPDGQMVMTLGRVRFIPMSEFWTVTP